MTILIFLATLSLSQISRADVTTINLNTLSFSDRLGSVRRGCDVIGEALSIMSTETAFFNYTCYEENVLDNTLDNVTLTYPTGLKTLGFDGICFEVKSICFRLKQELTALSAGKPLVFQTTCTASQEISNDCAVIMKVKAFLY